MWLLCLLDTYPKETIKKMQSLICTQFSLWPTGVQCFSLRWGKISCQATMIEEAALFMGASKCWGSEGYSGSQCNLQRLAPNGLLLPNRLLLLLLKVHPPINSATSWGPDEQHRNSGEPSSDLSVSAGKNNREAERGGTGLGNDACEPQHQEILPSFCNGH